MKPSFAIVGCGKVGTALGKFLVAAGYSAIGTASKSISSARKTADILKTARYSDVPWEVTKTAAIVLITTPDSAIADTCNRIAENTGFKTNAVVLHCSGALPSTILSSANRCGAFTGSIHPLQSFAADEYSSSPFEGIIVSIEGEEKALTAARQIAVDLGATCLTIATAAKTLYHAAAVVSSNYLVTLLEFAFRLLGEAGISGREAFNALQPLIAGTLSNIERVGIPEALTGPIARGDIETVKGHLDAIELKAPGLLALYKTLGHHTIDIATAKGTLSEAPAQQLKRILNN
ncbi:Rossmann-like and DUF2520 domain-containing protein [Thermodesulfobacteriota bacterium]